MSSMTDNKPVPYQSDSNLPICFTMPGAKIAQACITMHMPSSKDYPEKESNHVSWDKRLEVSSNKQIPPSLESNENLNSILYKPGSGNQTSTDINKQNSDEDI